MFSQITQDPFKLFLFELNTFDLNTRQDSVKKLIISHILNFFFKTTITNNKMTHNLIRIEDSKLNLINAHHRDKLKYILANTDLDAFNLTKTNIESLVKYLNINMEVTTPGKIVKRG